MGNTTIEWTNVTWNPVVGCSMVSAGCAHCYAERMSVRLHGMAEKRGAEAGRLRHYLPVIGDTGRWTGKVALVEEALADPAKWKSPRLVFVNSMSDVFHEDVPLDYIRRVFAVMRDHPQHTFQVLTKRSARLRELAGNLDWPANVWMGVSVENRDVLHRVDDLRAVPAAIRFLSCEPLIGSLCGLDLTGIAWVIGGGESGPGARPMRVEWAREIRDAAVGAGVAFFFKQWGALRFNPDAADPTSKENGGNAKGGRMLDGMTWDEMPARATTVSDPTKSASCNSHDIGDVAHS